MKIAQETVKELNALSASQLMIVHDLIISLKSNPQVRRSSGGNRKAYRKAQTAYAGFKGSLSDDICSMREDRV
jgi:hypothetical protein